MSGIMKPVKKNLIVGTYYAVCMDLQGGNENVLGKRNYQLTTNVLSQTAGTLGNNDLIGEHLFILATTYHLANDKIYRSGAKLFNTVVTRTLSEGITSFTVTVSHIFGIPKSAMPSGINMDVAMDRVIVVAKDGDTSKEKAYMDISGLVSSYHEHDIFEKIDGFSSVSAVRALQVAAGNNIPIKLINAANIGDMLPTLQVSAEIKTDIQNAVNAGREVTIPQTNITINDWNGVGYIVKDPITGSGTYMITGGLAGSDSTSQSDGMQIVEIFKTPLSWINDMLDLLTRHNLAYAAEINIGDILKGSIVTQGAQLLLPFYYDEVDCSQLVRISYWMAGICLDGDVGDDCRHGNNLADQYHIGSGNGVARFYAIADAQKLYGSVRANDPLVGDMIFWDDTYDPNKDCVANHPLTHMGIVQEVNFDGLRTLRFIHSSSSNGVVDSKPMNIGDYQNSTLGQYNTPLRSKYPPCKACGSLEICLGSSEPECEARSKPACSNDVWNNSSGKYSGQLFRGFGTVRFIPTTVPSH